MLNYHFPLRHSFLQLPIDPEATLNKAVIHLFQKQLGCLHRDDLLGFLYLEHFYSGDAEQPFEVSGDGYFLDEFLVASPTGSAAGLCEDEIPMPAIIAAQMYHEDDVEGRHTDAMHHLVYVDQHGVDAFHNSRVKNAALLHKLKGLDGKVSSRGHRQLDALDFPIYALQMYQRRLGIDPRKEN
ncbi:hypothetical protein [Tateyamaria sp.]|uniref:hypothetical protein n=1 Tax=Tateyamaria sp. TaxID=1929288 RepID=UPI00329B48E7